MTIAIPKISEQIRRNSVALISLFIAVFALAYNTWRNERSEDQRNIRQAAFRVLENLGGMQEIVDSRYYYFPFDADKGAESTLRLRGFGNLAMSHDLMNLMPPPVPTVGDVLYTTWLQHFNALEEIDGDGLHTQKGQQAEVALRNALSESREAVVNTLRNLD
jgi:hypothetical protein